MNTTKASPYGTGPGAANRGTAITVGVLYIIGTVAGILRGFNSSLVTFGLFHVAVSQA